MSQHPSNNMLQAYAEGQLNGSQALGITVHCEQCQHCRDMLNEFEAAAAETVFSASSAKASASAFSVDTSPNVGPDIASNSFEQSDDELDLLLAGMLDTLPPQDEIHFQPTKSETVVINDREFLLPRALNKLLPHLQQWKSYGGKVYSASFDINEADKVSLLYITQGVKVPQHTHKGNEITLVLHGSFQDENGEYHAGDYLMKDNSDVHTPQTVNEDCLCLTLLSDPMVFTQGIARVFNRFGKGMYP